MPRDSRNLPLGCVVHVVNRGNDKRLLFERSREFEEFSGLVAWAKAICTVRIVAYLHHEQSLAFCLFGRDRVGCVGLPASLTTTHAKRWRRDTRTVGHGHVYQDRFKASSIYSERYCYNCLRYVERNPAEAGLVRSATEWRWSALARDLAMGGGIVARILSVCPLGGPNLSTSRCRNPTSTKSAVH